MDRMPDWRPVESAGPDGRADSKDLPGAPDGAHGRRTLMLAAFALVATGGVALVLWAATPSSRLDLVAEPAAATLTPGVPAASAVPELLVDVQGAVERPGLYRLADGSRVGDAIQAAGGYSAAVDLDAAAQRLNLAERLSDGSKVNVPRRGEQAGAAATNPAAAGPASGGSALIDINVADQALLETLPGIGPVTAGKIIAARAEAPYASVDDLLARKVVGPATFDKVRPLVVVNP